MTVTKKAEAPKVEAVKKTEKVGKKRGPHGPRVKADPSSAKVHVGQLISQKMKSKGLSKNKMAKILGLTPPSISLMVSSVSVQTDRLMAVSEALGYNFFYDIAQKVPFGPGKAAESEKLTPAKIQAFEEAEIEKRMLKEENAYLKKIIELLAGGGHVK